MKKKAIAKITVFLIALVASLLVLMVFESGPIANLFGKAIGVTQCEASTLIGAGAKAGSAGILNTNINCPEQKITISMKELQDQEKYARAYIDEFNKRYPDSKFAEDDSMRFALNKMLASKLLEAWNALGKTDRNFFKDNKIPLGKLDVYCIVYAKINVEPDVAARLSGTTISLNEWMKKNKPLNKEDSYFDEITNDPNDPRLIYIPDFTYTLNKDVPMTVVFARQNLRWGSDFYNSLAGRATTTLGVGIIGAEIGSFVPVPVVGTVVGFGTGAAIGFVSSFFTSDIKNPPTEKSMIFLLPYDKLKPPCTELAN